MKTKWNGNFQEKMFENLGIPHEVVLFFGNYANSRFYFFLDISRMDDGDAYSKIEIL